MGYPAHCMSFTAFIYARFCMRKIVLVINMMLVDSCCMGRVNMRHYFIKNIGFYILLGWIDKTRIILSREHCWRTVLRTRLRQHWSWPHLRWSHHIWHHIRHHIRRIPSVTSISVHRLTTSMSICLATSIVYVDVCLSGLVVSPIFLRGWGTMELNGCLRLHTV